MMISPKTFAVSGDSTLGIGLASDISTYQDLAEWPSNPFRGDEDLSTESNARPRANRVRQLLPRTQPLWKYRVPDQIKKPSAAPSTTSV